MSKFSYCKSNVTNYWVLRHLLIQVFHIRLRLFHSFDLLNVIECRTDIEVMAM